MSTGIDGLDEILEGGVPANSTVILMGDKGTGKDAILNKFVYQGLENGQPGLYVTLDKSPEDVQDDVKYYGWDFQDYENKIVYVDGYSWQAGGSDHRHALEGLSDLNQMNMTFTDAMNDLKGENRRIAINSASTLLLYTDPTSTVKFLQVVSAKSTSGGGCLFITLEESTHEQKTKSTVEHIADGVIKVKMEGDQKMLSVSRMDKTEHTREWKEFKIDKDSGEITLL